MPLAKDRLADQASCFSTGKWYQIRGVNSLIVLEARPIYCDRGNWIAKIETSGSLAMSLDSQDMWPRYYMDFKRAIAEIEAWMKKRGEWIDNRWTLKTLPS